MNVFNVQGRPINTSNPSMLKFPPELIVHRYKSLILIRLPKELFSSNPPSLMFCLCVTRSSVLYLLYVVGGLLMTVTAGSRCVDAAVRTAQDLAELLRLSNALITLMGRGSPKRVVRNRLLKNC